MKVKDIRKALVAFATTALSAYLTAWAQTNGSMPGWPTVGAALLLGVLAGLTVFGVRNGDKPKPLSVQTTVARMAAERAAARLEQQPIVLPTGRTPSPTTRSTP